MIINIRGTHGSGKSTILKQLLQKHPHDPVTAPGKVRSEGYRVRVAGLGKPVFVVGPYATACGGCDAIQPYALIWPRIERYAKLGHVVFEGALVSTSLGVIGEAMVKRKKACVVAYLDTPIEVCLERIKKRRAAKGNTQPLNPKNTISKCAAIERTKDRFEALGVRCVTLKYKKAYEQLMEVLLESRKS